MKKIAHLSLMKRSVLERLALKYQEKPGNLQGGAIYNLMDRQEYDEDEILDTVERLENDGFLEQTGDSPDGTIRRNTYTFSNEVFRELQLFFKKEIKKNSRSRSFREIGNMLYRSIFERVAPWIVISIISVVIGYLIRYFTE